MIHPAETSSQTRNRPRRQFIAVGSPASGLIGRRGMPYSGIDDPLNRLIRSEDCFRTAILVNGPQVHNRVQTCGTAQGENNGLAWAEIPPETRIPGKVARGIRANPPIHCPTPLARHFGAGITNGCTASGSLWPCGPVCPVCVVSLVVVGNRWVTTVIGLVRQDRSKSLHSGEGFDQQF
jgi:hypothetical protein